MSLKSLKKYRNYIGVVLLVLTVLPACSNNEQLPVETPEDKVVFLFDPASESLVAVEYEEPEELNREGDDYILFLIQLLKEGVEGVDYEPTLPVDIGIHHVALFNGNVIINFDEKYDDMDGVKEMYARTSIVRTLTGNRNYGSVEIFVNNDMLTDYNGDPLGRQYNSSAVITYDEAIKRNKKHWITIYIPNDQGNQLVEKFLSVTLTPNKKIEEIVIEQLMSDQENGVIPYDVELLNVYTHEGICFVDFSSQFQTSPLSEGISERMAIYSIVNSLVELDHITTVQILVNGGVVSTFQNQLSLNRLFTKNHSLIQQK